MKFFVRFMFNVFSFAMAVTLYSGSALAEPNQGPALNPCMGGPSIPNPEPKHWLLCLATVCEARPECRAPQGTNPRQGCLEDLDSCSVACAAPLNDVLMDQCKDHAMFEGLLCLDRLPNPPAQVDVDYCLNYKDSLEKQCITDICWQPRPRGVAFDDVSATGE